MKAYASVPPKERQRSRRRSSPLQTPAQPRRTVPVQITAIRPQGRFRKPDVLVSEEPLEIRLAGPYQDPQTVGVTMRTPGNDFELAAGFLLSEGVLSSQDAILSVRYCRAPDRRKETERYNVVTVQAAHPVDLENQRRLFTISSACGVCGRAALDQIEKCVPSLPPSQPWPIELLVALPDSLRLQQTLFRKTGGLHGAGLFDRSGTALAVREDIGRHNAVDKLVGWAGLTRTLPLHECTLVVSGRLGFEIVQKAAMAGIPQVVAVSAPSSLAVDLARRVGMTVTAFVRGDQANLYCGEEAVKFPT
jgi:FdhD protein